VTLPPDGDASALAELIAATVTAHPSVARLHGGLYGDVATFLPSRRRLVGVRVGQRGEPVEVGVVLYLDRPIPEIVRALREQVADLSGGAAVDIVVVDVAEPVVEVAVEVTL
jgi:uncharacterized alkaline shock family protein YloU